MWRYLTGLNQVDFKEELNSIGGELPQPAPIIGIDHYSFIKATGVSFTQLNFIKEHIKGFDEVLVHVPSDGGEKCDLFFSFYNASRKRLQREISGVAELGELQQLLKNISANHWVYFVREKELKIDRTLIMGILNITPDSFSDGGKYFSEDSAYARAMEMLEAGADIIDIGGESTRPGSKPVSIDEEWRRISGVIDRLIKNETVIISVDTYKSDIARRALGSGVHIINDISGLTFDPAMAKVISDSGAAIILMHIKGTPRDMQKNPSYRNLMDEVYGFLYRQCRFAKENGIGQIIVDPGIGFGKRAEDNYELIRRFGEFKALGYPVLLGASRKSFIGFGLNDDQIDRMIGSITSALHGILNGANILRVHDVPETRQAILMADAIENLKAIT